MKVCLDANIVIDVVGASPDMLTSYAAWDVCLTRGYEVSIPASSLQTIVYVVPARKFKSKSKARETMAFLMDDCTLLDLAVSDCKLAFESPMSDFEDALIAYAALRHNVDLIITRNKKDFGRSPVPAMTPEEFLAAYKPDGIFYREVDGEIVVISE